MNALAQTLSHAVPSGFGNRIHLLRQVSDVTQRAGQMLTRKTVNLSPLDKHRTIYELNRLRLLADVMTPDGLLTSGTEGTAVYRYRDGIAFEVEFRSPIPALLTLRADEVALLYV